MAIVTMTSTVGNMTSGQTYRTRAKYVEQLVRNTQGTKVSTTRQLTGANPHLREGK